MKKIIFRGFILAFLSFALTSGLNYVLAQNWTEPASAPPGGNVPGVIWNSQVSGSQQTASFYVSGTGRVGQGGAFGNFAPDAVWMVSSPNAYFGNGVAGTIIGAGGGQNAGDIKTDGNLYVVGRTGIGTINPGVSTRLQVTGLGLFTGGTYNPGDGTPAGTEIGFNTAANYGFIQPVTTGVAWWPLAINPGGGNVGIGTVSPGSKLDVAGNVNSSGDVIGARLCIGADCRNAWPVAGGGGDITAVNVGTGITGGGVTGDVTVSLDTAYTDGRYVNVAGDTMTGSLVISGAGNDLTVADSGAFGTFSPDATWKVSSPNAYFGNGVAGTIIGAGGGLQAGQVLTDGHVYLNGGDLFLAGTAGQTYTQLYSYSNADSLWLLQSTSPELFLSDSVNYDRGVTIQYTPGVTGAVSGRLVLGQLSRNSATFTHGITSLYTNGTEQVRVDSAGNVGIGTTSPGSRLDVSGNINSSGDVIGARLCIGVDCRNVWPAGGGGSGDITSVQPNVGLTGGAFSGDAVLSLDTAFTDARYLNVGEGGDITGVTAGSGLFGGGLSGDVTLNIGAGASISVAADTVSWTGNTLAAPSGLTGNGTAGSPLAVNPGIAMTIAVDGRVSWIGNSLAANSGLKGNGTPGNPLQVGAGVGISVTGDTVNFGGLTKALTSGLKGSGSQAAPLYIGSGNGIIVGNDYIAVNNNTFVNEGGDSMSGNYTITGSLCLRNASACPGSAAGTIYVDTAYAPVFDIAEYILSKNNLEPGDVVVIDPDVDEQVLRSYKANDTAVAGVVSTKPGWVGGYALEATAGTQKVILTLAGRIPVKVTDEGGPIKRGDLLTTSNTPGYAMKCAESVSCVGAVVGKAMGELKEGKGMIVVLMSLQ